MAPTTLLGQKTTSTPLGRDARLAGYPLPITEMLAILPGVDYVARGTVADAGSIGKLKAMLRRACEIQVGGGGFALVEALSNCPVGWGMTAPESIAHLAAVAETYPIGVILDRAKGIGVPPAATEA
jgi:2-oxoglutarate ferredoxin oxidoreductase subunit beta